MASMRKKIFLGSVAGFTPTGIEEFIARIKNSSESPESVPFLRYHDEHKVFSCTLDAKDQKTIPYLIRELKDYIQIQASKTISLEEDINIVPVATIRTAGNLSNKLLEDEPLVELQDEVKANEEDNTPVVAEWIPKNGKVDTLSADIANQISQLTGSNILIDASKNKAHLIGGNVNKALQKLQNMEPLLELMGQHQDTIAPVPSPNILFLPENNLRVRLEYVYISNGHPGFNRIMVKQRLKDLLRKSMVGELRFLKDDSIEAPANPDAVGVSATSMQQASKIWDGIPVKTIAPEKYEIHETNANVNPSELETDRGQEDDRLQDSYNRYLAAPAVARVAAWTRDVVHGDGFEEETVGETKETTSVSQRRRLVVDSDEEEEDDDNL